MIDAAIAVLGSTVGQKISKIPVQKKTREVK